MKSFLVGLLMLCLFAVLSVAAVLLLPLLLLLGIFLRLVLGLILGLFMIWLIGKVTLVVIDFTKGREQHRIPKQS